MAAIAGILDSRRWSGALASDTPAVVGLLLSDLVRFCEREGVAPVGTLEVEPLYDVFENRTDDYAWRWKLELAEVASR